MSRVHVQIPCELLFEICPVETGAGLLNDVVGRWVFAPRNWRMNFDDAALNTGVAMLNHLAGFESVVLGHPAPTLGAREQSIL